MRKTPVKETHITVTNADRAAADVKKSLDATTAAIPGLMRPHPATSRSIRGHRTVPRDFIRSMINVVDQLEVLQTAGSFDTKEAEAALQFEAAFRSVTDDVARLLANLNYTIDVKVAAVAAKALQTYAVAKGLARDPRNRKLTILLRQLQRDLGRKGPRKKKK
ncbi:MAG TPA: hypothetical protein VNN08_18420 [Thermoanaerobaculia bacterium]|nr:hypothetical protein [Thermoanaerobaculia bacterium]